MVEPTIPEPQGGPVSEPDAALADHATAMQASDEEATAAGRSVLARSTGTPGADPNPASSDPNPAGAADPGEPGAPEDETRLLPKEPEVLSGRNPQDSSLWRWKGPISLVGGALFALLGLMIVLGAFAHGGDDSLQNARPADLVAILDSLENDVDRLEGEKRLLEGELSALTSGTNKEALERSQERLQALQILSGTTKVRGPGIEIVISDPQGGVEASDILDAVQELRDAGAESIEFAERRVVVNTWFADVPPEAGGGIIITGDPRRQPYVIKAIGNPDTLSTAMEIPGGVADTMRLAEAKFEMKTKDNVTIEATVPLETPEYAEPAPAAE